MPTMNRVDMMNCAAGHHDFSDDSDECHVCGYEEADADEKPFTIPEIGIGMDDSEYIKAVDLIGTAATLAGDGEGGELGRNAEYERGMAELIARFMNWSGDRVPEVIAAIHGTAKDANRAR